MARLLAEIGDARGRYPTPEVLTSLAGAAPSTTVRNHRRPHRGHAGAVAQASGRSRWADPCELALL